MYQVYKASSHIYRVCIKKLKILFSYIERQNIRYYQVMLLYLFTVGLYIRDRKRNLSWHNFCKNFSIFLETLSWMDSDKRENIYQICRIIKLNHTLWWSKDDFCYVNITFARILLNVRIFKFFNIKSRLRCIFDSNINPAWIWNSNVFNSFFFLNSLF